MSRLRRGRGGRPHSRHERRAAAAPGGAGRDPQGRDRQGRGPRDRRRRARRRRAPPRAPGRGRRPSGRAQHGLEADRRGDQGGRKAGRPRGRGAASPIDRDRRAPVRPRRPSWRRSRPRSRTACCASRIPPSRTCRSGARRPTSPSGRWGEQLPARRAASTARSAPMRARGAETWERKPHWEIAEALDIIDLRPRREDRRLGLPGLQGRAARALERALITLFLDVHTRENGFTEIWPPIVVNAASCPRHGPDPGQGRPDVRRHARRPVPGPDRRGAGHEPPPRRDPRGRRAADPLRRLHAVLPPRGGRRRQGHPRHPPRPPVRQGRDGPVRAPGRLGARRSSG